jgi:hypothetical protein
VSLIPIFLLGTYLLIFNSLKKKGVRYEVLLTPVIIFLLGLPMAVGTIHLPPISLMLRKLYENSFFLLAFRANHRFLALLAFVYPTLIISVTAWFIMSCSSKKRMFVPILFVMLLPSFFNIIPVALNLPVQERYRIFDVPMEYSIISNIINHDPQAIGVLILPPTPNVSDYSFGDPRTNLWRALIEHSYIVDAETDARLKLSNLNFENKNAMILWFNDILQSHPYVKYVIIDGNYRTANSNTVYTLSQLMNRMGLHLIAKSGNVLLYYKKNHTFFISAQTPQPTTVIFRSTYILDISFNETISNNISLVGLPDSKNWEIVSGLPYQNRITIFYRPQIILTILLLSSSIVVITMALWSGKNFIKRLHRKGCSAISYIALLLLWQ